MLKRYLNESKSMTTENKIVSVVIPTYNRANFIADAVASVIKQSYRNIEIIVVDDGSTDNTRKMLYPYLKNKDIIYIYQNNRGVSAARNLGTMISKGKYISFLDSDDFWKRDKLQKQMDFLLSQSEYRICYTDEIWVRNGKKINQKKIHQKYSGWIYEKCLPLCIISPSSVIMEKKIFFDADGFDENLPACEDYDLWLRLSAKYPIYYIDEKLIIKRGGHADQLSHSFIAIDEFRVTALMKSLNGYKLSKNKREKTLEMLKYKCYILIRGYTKHNKVKLAEKYQNIINHYIQPLY